jgi:hypothetical protein
MQLYQNEFSVTKKGQPKLPFYVGKLLLDDFQDLHGASLDTDAAGNALGGRCFRLQDHDLHGAGFHALAAGNALLLVDHVDTGLGVLGDGLMLASLHALAALNADHGLGSIALCSDLNAGQIGIEFLIKCLRASLNALQASHALGIFLNSQLFHNGGFSFLYILQ